jgi:hypothetical protein
MNTTTDHEIAGEHIQEVLGRHAEHCLVRVVLADLAVGDLLDFDVGESGAVKESVAQRVSILSNVRCIELVRYLTYVAADRFVELAMEDIVSGRLARRKVGRG